MIPRVGPVRVAARLTSFVVVVVTAAAVLPITPRAWRSRTCSRFARALLWTLGITHHLRGTVPGRRALVVCNHLSWLDTVVLLAHLPIRPVAKREMRGWPLVGVVATAADALFIDRSRPRTLPDVVTGVADALRAGHVVLAFPEGTTWCGTQRGTFRPALFQAAIDAGVPVLPVTLGFSLADGTGTTIAAYLDDDTLVASLRRVARVRGLQASGFAHQRLYPTPGACRRTLARAAHAAVIGSPSVVAPSSPLPVGAQRGSDPPVAGGLPATKGPTPTGPVYRDPAA
jgi:1-acyl-sn-glycerol-3-phosphate acyltransferase